MVDDLELVRMVFDIDPIPTNSAPRESIRERLLAEIASSDTVGTSRHPRGASAGKFARTGRKSRVGIVAGAAVAVIAAGGGVAAAAGVLPLPWSTTKAAVSFMNSANPAAVPGAVVRLSVAGPESTVIKVVSDVVDNTAQHLEYCSTLSVTGPQGHLDNTNLNGNGACMFGSAPPGSTTSASQIHLVGPTISLSSLRAPSGAIFHIVWGIAPGGAAAVELNNNHGLVGAKGSVAGGYYTIWLPAPDLMAYSSLTFFNSSGETISSQNLEG